MEARDVVAYAAVILSALTALLVVRQTYRFNSLLKRTETVYKLKHDTYVGFITLITSWMGEADTTADARQARMAKQEALFESLRRAWLFAPRKITQSMRSVIDRAFSGEPIDELLKDLVIAMRSDLTGDDHIDRDVIFFDIVVQHSAAASTS